MSYVSYLLRRFAFAVLSVYAAATAMFAFIVLQIRFIFRQQLAFLRSPWAKATEQEVERFRQSFVAQRGLDEPLYERYLHYLVDLTTLEWGQSVAYGEPVAAVLDGRVVTTLEYVLPGVVIAIALGVPLGVLAAFEKDGAVDWSARLSTYALLGVPVFMVITYVLAVVSPARGGQSAAGGLSVHPQVIAAFTVAVSLLAGQLRFSRSAVLDQTGREFVKMLRAKGISRLTLVRHVLRNAALPIVSLSLTELLAVLVLNIYVIEEILPIDGLARASLVAVDQGDMSLVTWSTLVIVFLGIAGSFLQDVLYGYLDPQVSVE
ncbi:ABC transporter permease [Halolamina sp. CBA1230]|uniref:ABC transporter permease n=1 Tax=Halolamina sp. CBA1230 TaxID=1853690 RepID=UPI0009A19670|nr:ABC transporter permease [Halolamina sp. CBA1230]QKY19441.1 ABC transporter permease [Halolamina sp. CBA1230]